MQTQYSEVKLNPMPITGMTGHRSWHERRDHLRAHIKQQLLPGIGADEVEAHFSTMPAHYWERVTLEELIWGLETIHGFLQLLNAPNLPATRPLVNCRYSPALDRTQVMLCTWDRHGLLAKAAAALSAVNLNIHQADVFTRNDNIALDLFGVTDTEGRARINEERLREMNFLLEGALSEPPRFASVWACSRHKLLAPPDRFSPRISFDNHASPDSTLVHVEASDRLGLLYDILQTLADAELNITQATIETREVTAHDTIYVKNARGQKLLDARQLEALRHKLEAALVMKS